MPLQNRVTPAGELVAVAARGTMMGNRGVLHNAAGRIVRHSQIRRWIACRTSYKGRKLPLAEPGRNTQLFFLDEATAFAAGHRPCAACRFEDYRKFRDLWAARFGKPANVDVIDNALHAERVERKMKRTWESDIADLPDGTFVMYDGAPRIIWGRDLVAWGDAGYYDLIPRPVDRIASVLTPPSIVRLFRDGYRPGVHPTLFAALEQTA